MVTSRAGATASPSLPDVRLGIVGAGNMGQRMATASSAVRGVRLGAVADPDPVRAEGLAAGLGVPYFTDGTAMAASGTVDAVYLAVPHRAHARAAIDALSAGWHVLVDKPMAETENEAVQMLGARDRAGTVLMVGFSHRFTSQLRYAKRVVESGELGELVLASDLIVEAITDSPSWYWNPEGGGVLQLQAHHSFDRLAWLVGSPIVEVMARVRSSATSSRDDAAAVGVRFANGTIGTVGLGLQNGYASTPIAELVLQGTAGVLRIDTWQSVSVETAQRQVMEHTKRDAWLECELAEFIGAIRHGRQPLVSGEDGLAALRVATAARLSAQKHVPVAVKLTMSPGTEG